MFFNRVHAGELLAEKMHREGRFQNPVILGLPRGGVVVAAEIAHRFEAALDILLVKKLGVPGDPELAFGAIGFGGTLVENQDVIREVGLTREKMAPVIEAQKKTLEELNHFYRKDRAPLSLKDQDVVIVDDGIATGATIRAAVQLVKEQKPRTIVIAVPVAPPSVIQMLEPLVDQIICLAEPKVFFGVGAWYEDFRQVTSDEVVLLLENAPQKSSLKKA